MGSVKDYFSGLGSGFLSLLKGMQVTGKEFVTPKITEKYPENRETHHIPQRFRACLELKYDDEGNHKCIACGTCERNCPNGTINVLTKSFNKQIKINICLSRNLTNISMTWAAVRSVSFAW